MTAGKLCPSIAGLAERLLSEHLIETEGREVLRDVVAQLGSRAGMAAGDGSWSYSIWPKSPLRFARSEKCNSYRFEVDIFCDLAGHGLDALDPLTTQNVVVRAWTSERSLFYRDRWDHPRFEEHFCRNRGGRRAIIRYRFDRAGEDSRELAYHFQFGGRSGTDELCWHPRKLDVPRVMHPPVDLVLACESVVANFFPRKYAELCKDPEWWELMKTSERLFVAPYLQRCREATAGRTTLFQSLCGM